MRRAKSLLTLPVVSLNDGRVVGHVRDVVFDPQSRRIAGFLLREATWLSDALVVPLERVRSLGRDAVTVTDKAAVQASIRARPLRRLLNSGVRLSGLHVLTETGVDLGTIDEVFISPSGEIVGYELNPGVVEETLRGKRLIPGTELLTAGPDAAIVPAGVEQLIRRPEQLIEVLEGAGEATVETEPSAGSLPNVVPSPTQAMSQ